MAFIISFVKGASNRFPMSAQNFERFQLSPNRASSTTAGSSKKEDTKSEPVNPVKVKKEEA